MQSCRTILLLLLCDLLIPFSAGSTYGVCTSQGGRFTPFSSEGKPPKRASRGSKDLTLCRVFRKKTCCDVAQTHPALLTIRKLASTGEASQECLQLWELLECSICDPNVGVQQGPPLICASLCDRVFEACYDAYLSMDTTTQVLAPCGVGDFVCGRASEWVSNGTDLCGAAGFAVKPYENKYLSLQETSCYGGKVSLDSISDSWSNPQSNIPKKTESWKNPRSKNSQKTDSWKNPQSKIPQKTQAFTVLDDFLQWTNNMHFKDRVSWAVGGMVLTAGLLFVSKRKSHSQRQKLTAIQHTARRLKTKTSSISEGRKKTNGK